MLGRRALELRWSDGAAGLLAINNLASRTLLIIGSSYVRSSKPVYRPARSSTKHGQTCNACITELLAASIVNLFCTESVVSIDIYAFWHYNYNILHTNVNARPELNF